MYVSTLADLESLGARARVESSPCGDGRMVWRRWGQGTPLVLLHGGTGSWNHWCRNISALAERYEVIAPDLPGLGDSDLPPKPFTGEGIADILERGIDRLLGPDRRFHMACFSFGSVGGGIMAARLGARVISFTCVGSAGFGPRDKPTEGMVRIRPEMSEAEQRATARRNLSILMIADPANIDELAVDIQLMNNRRSRLFSRPISLSDGLARALPRMKARRNAIWGEKDATIVGMLERRNAIIRAADPAADIRVLDGIGHWVQYEAAQIFNAALLEILGASGD